MTVAKALGLLSPTSAMSTAGDIAPLRMCFRDPSTAGMNEDGPSRRSLPGSDESRGDAGLDRWGRRQETT